MPSPSLTVSTTYYAILLPVNVSIPGTYSNSTSVVANADVLYSYSGTLTFTQAGATGSTGPTLSQCVSAYASFGSWVSNTAYFNMTTQGIQRWTVPATRTYTIVCAGAGSSGNRAILTATFSLIKGDVLNILVGQVGSGQIGSGGSFVVKSDGVTALIIAGGAGGAGALYNTGFKDANTSTGGGGGSGGLCNTNFIFGGGGGTGGASGANGGFCASAPGYPVSIPPGYGGCGMNNFSTITTGFSGGFGGGGGTTSYNGGGGGGYSGGGGGGGGAAGGGGGSYCSVTITSSSATTTGNGYVSIT